MYLKVNEEYGDAEIELLSALLTIIDKEIAEIADLSRILVDPESDGLMDRGEYFIGVGFSAIQQYFTDTLTLTGIGKKRALNIGPRYSDSLTFVAVVNAAANWWKHSAEWVGLGKQCSFAVNTQAIVIEITEGNDYPLSNVLAKLQSLSGMTLCALLPDIVLWRSAVDNERQGNT